jgi:hypothetical protein
MITHSSFLYQLPAPRVLHNTGPEPAHRWVPVLAALALLPALFAMSSCCPSNSIRKIPTIRGRVVEAKTNRPIAGARLARWFEREDGCLAPGGSDVHPVAGSFLTAISGNDGSFEWPAWSRLMSPIRGMQWYVYHPDWIVGDGWFNQPRPGLDGYLFGTTSAEPWVHLVSHPVGSQLEVTITMEPKDSTAAWEAHFHRLEILTRYGQLNVAYFVTEAERFVASHDVPAAVLSAIAQVGGSLGGFHEGRPCYRGDLAFRLLALQEQICKRNPQTPGCDPGVLRWRRSFLESECRTHSR